MNTPKPLPPRRAYELDLKVSGDTGLDVLAAFRDVYDSFQRNGRAPRRTWIRRIHAHSYTLETNVDETVTHDDWAAKLDEYLVELAEWEAEQTKEAT